MTVTWRILSPRSPRQMLEVERDCERALERYLTEHPNVGGRWGEFSTGGTVPRRADVEAAYRHLRVELPPRVRQRLESCESVMAIDSPGDLETSPIQVSLLRFILDRVGAGLIIFNDYPLEETEAVLDSLRSHRGAAGFADVGRTEHDRQTDPQPALAQKRALRVLEVVRAAEANIDLAVDLRDALSRLPPLARRYLTLLYEEGVVDDRKASRLLAVKLEELEPAIQALDLALREIAQS